MSQAKRTFTRKPLSSSDGRHLGFYLVSFFKRERLEVREDATASLLGSVFWFVNRQMVISDELKAHAASPRMRKLSAHEVVAVAHSQPSTCRIPPGSDYSRLEYWQVWISRLPRRVSGHKGSQVQAEAC